jgi:sRNA-binding carbon storage regulator CsrA
MLSFKRSCFQKSLVYTEDVPAIAVMPAYIDRELERILLIIDCPVGQDLIVKQPNIPEMTFSAQWSQPSPHEGRVLFTLSCALEEPLIFRTKNLPPIEVMVTLIESDGVRLSFHAPREVKIDREEVFLSRQGIQRSKPKPKSRVTRGRKKLPKQKRRLTKDEQEHKNQREFARKEIRQGN